MMEMTDGAGPLFLEQKRGPQIWCGWSISWPGGYGCIRMEMVLSFTWFMACLYSGLYYLCCFTENPALILGRMRIALLLVTIISAITTTTITIAILLQQQILHTTTVRSLYPFRMRYLLNPCNYNLVFYYIYYILRTPYMLAFQVFFNIRPQGYFRASSRNAATPKAIRLSADTVTFLCTRCMALRRAEAVRWSLYFSSWLESGTVCRYTEYVHTTENGERSR